MTDEDTAVWVDGVRFTESMAATRDVVKSITSKYDRRYWLTCVEEERHPYELLEAVADAGLTGIGLSEELGGAGGGIREQAAMTEALGEAGLPQNYWSLGFYTRRLVERIGSPSQKEWFIKSTLEGMPHTCMAITEGSSGTNAFAMRTFARREDDRYVVNGEKMFISGAADAKQMLLLAKTKEASEDNRAELSLFLVNLEKTPGITMTPMRITVLAPEKQYVVNFDDVELPLDALIGEEGKASRAMFTVLNGERITSAANTVGNGRFVLTKGAEYARIRAPFGKPIGTYQSVQHMLAKPHVALLGARRLVFDAAAQHDRGEDPSELTLAAKYAASESAFDAIDATVQVHGGSGFDLDSDVITWLDVLRIRRIAPINNESALSSIAESALGLPRSPR
ncbi:acyl-CoA dehydrogenase family protein [Shinella sp.]|uniref:acyl-CoA dehydrogenase family protein n=1 Tax=Shinella sp. TaxID=1870904 RepID=UPI0039E51E19